MTVNEAGARTPAPMTGSPPPRGAARLFDAARALVNDALFDAQWYHRGGTCSAGAGSAERSIEPDLAYAAHLTDFAVGIEAACPYALRCDACGRLRSRGEWSGKPYCWSCWSHRRDDAKRQREFKPRADDGALALRRRAERSRHDLGLPEWEEEW